MAAIEVVSNAASSPDAAPLAGVAVAPFSPENSLQHAGIDNSFEIGKPVLDTRKGTARLPVTVPGAGTLILAGSGVSTTPVSGPGTVTLQVRARGRKRGMLRRNGTVGLKLTLTFLPSGGQPNTKTATLKLKKR